MTLDYKEQVVDRKLSALRTQMLEEDPVLITAPYYEKLYKILKSPLHSVFKTLPKPAVHHTHLTAAADVKTLINFTYNSYVYYSEKEDLFYTNKHGCNLPGYLKVNTLRQYAHNATDFDNMLRDKILIKCKEPEDHAIWKEF